MLPAAFIDSYKQYKADTAEAISWLVENCPTSVDVLGPSSAVKTPRLKGKARRAQNEKLAVQTYTLKVAQILRLIREFTTKSNSIVEVPRRTIHILEQAIRLRRRATAWYTKQSRGSSEARKSTGNHEFFTSILERLMEAYRTHNDLAHSAQVISSVVAATEQTSILPPVRSDNIFDILELEDPDSENEVYTKKREGDNVKDQTSESIAKVSVNVEEAQNPTEDMTFKIFCMIQDLERLRLFIRRAWQGYCDDSISLMNASSSTSVALHFARGIQDRFMASFPQYSDWAEVLAAISPISKKQDSLNLNHEDSYLYHVPYRVLSAYNEKRSIEIPPRQMKSHGGTTSDKTSPHDLELERQDIILLAQVLREYPVLSFWGTPAQDELTKGLLALHVTKVQLSQVFGCQILLDVHHILGDALPRVLRELRVGAAAMKSAVDTFLRTEDATDVKIDKRTSEIFHFHSKWIGNNINEDALKRLRSQSLRSGDGTDPYDLKPFFILSQQPLLCGVLLTALTLDLQNMGLSLVNKDGAAVDVSHLYNAVRQSDLMFFPWPAMDRLIATWPGRFFIGPQPTEAQGFRNRYQLMTGVSPAHFASDHMSRRRALSKDGEGAYLNSTKETREPCEFPPVLDHFRQWYSASEKKQNLTVEHVEALVNTLLTPAEQRSQKRSNTKEAMSPVKMLSRLQEAFAKEEPLVLLDYFGIHRKMLEVLHHTELAVHEKVASWYIETRDKKARKLSHSQFMFLVTDSILEYGAAVEPYYRKEGEDMLIVAGEIIERIALRGLVTEDGRLFEAIRANQSETTPLSRGTEPNPDHPNQGGQAHVDFYERSFGPACLWGILEPCPVISCQKGIWKLGGPLDSAIVSGSRRLEEL